MASRLLTDLDPFLQPIAQSFIDKCGQHNDIGGDGFKVILTCTYRSDDEQETDYAQGRTTAGRVITNAKAGQSAHNCCLADGTPAARAFDFAIENEDGVLDWNASDPAWMAAIAIGKELGFVTGSSWKMKDNPHMELANWRSNPAPLADQDSVA